MDYNNKYLLRTVLYDLVIAIIATATVYILDKYKIININYEKSYVSGFVDQLLSNSLSMAGFLFTALTIILAIKENMENRRKTILNSQVEESGPSTFPTGIELLFGSKHYKKIVRTFFQTIVILFISYVYFGMLKVFWNELCTPIYFVLIGFLFIVLAIVRGLIILSYIIRIHAK